MVIQLVFQVILLLLLLLLLWLPEPLAATPSLAKSGCNEWCGNISIPYPFGMGAQYCYHGEFYKVTCNTSFSPPRPFMRKLNLELLGVYLENQTLTISNQIVSVCEKSVQSAGGMLASTDLLDGSPFFLSQGANKFTVMGCGNAIVTQHGKVMAGCSTVCHEDEDTVQVDDGGSCYGVNCCQTSISSYLYKYSINMTGLESQTMGGCGSAFLVDQNWSPFGFQDPFGLKSTNFTVPLVLLWTLQEIRSWSNCYSDGGFGRRWIELGNGSFVESYQCFCAYGYEGNPYLANGCEVVEACVNCTMGFCNRNYTEGPQFSEGPFYCRLSEHKSGGTPLKMVLGVSISTGLLMLATISFWLYKVVKKIKKKKRKEKFFKRNGGLLLQQQISADRGGIEKTRLFNARELEKATDQFNENRILGRGGQGTVYKGMLTDGEIVAIKKSKLVDESRVAQFINEVVILSQINHRNVVKLLGCCLETEVPLLVYEFVSNGTLSQHIHDESDDFPISWKMRLRIASEIAGALAYLHSATTIPIYHRDIKSTNILLDDKYKAKVSDFGTSKSVGIDQTHLTTLVKGTFGYLDPEYFQSSQFTEKSDVYSFGVVLVELLTGRKSIFSTGDGETRSLATHFLEETQSFGIIDVRVQEEGDHKELKEISILAKRCLNLNGKVRPTMKEVAMELEGIRTSHMCSNTAKDHPQVHCSTKIELEPVDLSCNSPLMHIITASSDVKPLLFNTV